MQWQADADISNRGSIERGGNHDSPSMW